jgi:hypothetical protein
MSRILPSYIFREKNSKFDKLIFDVEFHELTNRIHEKIVAEFIINPFSGDCELNGKGILKEVELIPPSVFNYEDKVKEDLLESKYKDFEQYFLSMFTASKINKVMRNSEEFTYQEFIAWIKNNLLYETVINI